MESGVLRQPLALRELRERVVDANVQLARAGLVTLTFGNASAADRGAGVIAIKPKKTAALVMTVVMPRSVADACQGATFRITFTVHAVHG